MDASDCGVSNPVSKTLFAPRQSRKTVSAAAFSGIPPMLPASID
jgi:hypothetical protein